MNLRRRYLLLATLLCFLGWASAGCSVSSGTVAPGTGGSQGSTSQPVAEGVPRPPGTATLVHTPPATPTAISEPTWTPTTRPIEFTILHTNDSRGFVDPCG